VLVDAPRAARCDPAHRGDRLAEAKADLDFQHNAENLLRTRHIHAHVAAISEHLGLDVPEESVSLEDLMDLPELNHDGDTVLPIAVA
jgi:hypothetical protein